MPDDVQGRIATVETDASDASAVVESGGAIDLMRLYRLWEENNWSATAIDFSQDAVEWRERVTEQQRVASRWSYSLFLHGEEAVARTLAPFVAAVPTQEQRIYLTTQIVDEARHHVFFDRFLREVMGEGSDVTTTLSATRDERTTGFNDVFGELDRLTDRLRRRPGDRTLLAQCFCIYHIVVEGMLAHPGQHAMLDYLTKFDMLHSFAAGIRHVSRDESRHMAFGIQVLGELVAADPAARKAVIALLNRVLPSAVGVFVPPRFDESYLRAFDLDIEELYAFGLRSLQAKLRRVGIRPEEVAALVKLGADLPVDEQARRVVTLLRAGVLTDEVPPAPSDAVMDLLFDGVQRLAAMPQAGRLPAALQWDFTDADPWYLAWEDCRPVVRRGRAPSPALTLISSAGDWMRVAGAQIAPLRALLTGTLRVRGDLRHLVRLPSILGT